MDAELKRLVEAVRDGRIVDTDRCRAILHDARTANLLEGEILQADNRIVQSAERAFLLGWPDGSSAKNDLTN